VKDCTLNISLAFLIAVSLVCGCASSLQSIKRTGARLGDTSGVHADLISLPAPKEKIVAAVYRFRDQTGQYKYSDTGYSWSTAITQGATSMLIKALDDSGWFMPLERESLSNLLNERKIISTTRQQYRSEDGEQLSPLPPLLYAGITLEGGIISYETNTFTGGFGARYFGLGGSTQIRKDEVNVYLRAVSTQTGKILKSVYTTKSILSQEVDVGLYRYVKVKRLLELETGYSTNEPPNMCVLEAIEKAVLCLITEGISDGLWALNDLDDINSPVIQTYLDEKEAHYRPFEFLETERDTLNTSNIVTKNIGIGFDVSVQNYAGDYPDPKARPAMDIFLRYGVSDRFSLAFNTGYGELADKDNFNTGIACMELRGIVSFFPRNRLNLYVFAGGGSINFWAEDKQGNRFKRGKDFGGWEPTFLSGIGLEYFINKHLSANMTFDNHFTLSDQLDGIISGDIDDTFWNGKAGLIFYLF